MTVSKMGMALIEEFKKRQEEKRNTQHFYEVYKDVEIIDDMGDEPVKRLSTYKYSFYCDDYLTSEEAVKYAESRENWECDVLKSTGFIGTNFAYVEYYAPTKFHNPESWADKVIISETN